MMNRFIIMVIVGLGFILTGCGEEETGSEAVSAESDQDQAAAETEVTEETGSEKVTDIKGTIKPEDFDKVFSDPNAYKGYEVNFTGKVFVQPERDADGTYLQVYADPEN